MSEGVDRTAAAIEDQIGAERNSTTDQTARVGSGVGGDAGVWTEAPRAAETSSDRQDTRGIAEAGAGTRTHGPGRELSLAERAAHAALMRYDKNIVEIAFYDEIQNYGNGTLVLAEVYWPSSGEGGTLDGPYEYQVVVRDGRGQVYDSFSHTFREGSRRTETISRLASPDVVTAILTFVLVVAYITLVGTGNASADAAQALGGALTTVLGFWFGRQSKA